MDRFRKLAGFLEANPGASVTTDEVLKFIQIDGDGGDPATVITINSKVKFS